MSEAGPGTAVGDRRSDLRLVIEGLGLPAVVMVAGRALELAAGEPSVGTSLGVLLPAFLLFQLLLVAGAFLLAGEAGARERLAALDPSPGWTASRQGLLVGVVGVAALALAEGALDVRGRAAVDAARPVVEFVRAHPWASLAVVSAGGVVEEVIYRGWGLLLVRRSRPSLTVPALAASSLLFGAAHLLVPVAGFVHYTLLGLVFGAAALASGSVVPAAVVHAGMNATVVAILVFGA